MLSCFGKTKHIEETEVMRVYPDGTAVNNVRPRPTSSRPASASSISPEFPESGQSGQDQEHHHGWINTRIESNVKMEEPKSKVKKKEKRDKKQKIKKIEEEHRTTLKETNKKHQIIVEEKDAKIAKQIMEIQKLEEEKETLLTRLSAMASAKLTDGNANIADLSDENRPTKLAEKYSELYDNEWTDAYDLLTKHGETEENTCCILLKALCMAYNKCRGKSEDDMKTMRDAMRNFLDGQDPGPELIKPFKDQRKKKIKKITQTLEKSFQSEVGTILRLEETRTDPKMKIFLKNSIKLCWLMVIQDPPVFMDVNIKRSGDKYDNDSLKPYTQSGKYIDFMVWPPIYLQEGGSVLFKGIVQCKPNKKDTDIDIINYHTSEHTATDSHDPTDVNRQAIKEIASAPNDEIIGNTTVQPQGNETNEINEGRIRKDAAHIIKPQTLHVSVLVNEATKNVEDTTQISTEKVKCKENDTSTFQNETYSDNISKTEQHESKLTADRLSACDTTSQSEGTREAKQAMPKPSAKKRKFEPGKNSQRNSTTVTTRSVIEESVTQQVSVAAIESFNRRSETFFDSNTNTGAYVSNKSSTAQSQSASKTNTSNINGLVYTEADSPKHSTFPHETKERSGRNELFTKL